MTGVGVDPDVQPALLTQAGMEACRCTVTSAAAVAVCAEVFMPGDGERHAEHAVLEIRELLKIRGDPRSKIGSLR
jgi:hypothetical protein